MFTGMQNLSKICNYKIGGYFIISGCLRSIREIPKEDIKYYKITNLFYRAHNLFCTIIRP